MKKRICLFLIFTLALLSCAKSEDVNLSFEDSYGDTIPLSDALSELDAFLVDIGRVPTRSASSSLYDMASVSSFGAKDLAPATRSFAEDMNMPDSLFYMVNFQDNGGFAILSANKSLGNKVIAATEAGNIDPQVFCDVFSLLQKKGNDGISEELFVPTLLLSSSMLHLNGAVESLVDTTVDGDLDGDSESMTRAGRGGNSTTDSTGVRVLKYGPHVKTKWNQHSPFNDLVDGAKPAGCCAIATSQIIVANRKSPSMLFDGVACSWDDLESVRNYLTPSDLGDADAQTQVAHFIKVIRSKEYCNINSNGSGDSIGAKRTFEKFGYKNVTRYWGMGENARDAIHQCLRQKYPVYIDGVNKGLFSSGHCWLVDGYIDRQTTTRDSRDNGQPGRHGGSSSSRSLTSRVHHEYYHHINWGWRGKYDGYYHIDDFQVSNRQSTDEVIDKETASLTDSSVEGGNYTWDIWIVTYSL